MDKFLDKHNSPKLSQNGTKSEYLCIKENEFIIKDFPERKILAQKFKKVN